MSFGGEHHREIEFRGAMGGHAAAGTEHAAACLNGGGEMGARMRAFDWAPTPLGTVDTWSQSLRTAVGIANNSRYPMLVRWGPHRDLRMPRMTATSSSNACTIYLARHLL